MRRELAERERPARHEEAPIGHGLFGGLAATTTSGSRASSLASTSSVRSIRRAKNSTSELGRTRLKPRSSAMLGDDLDQRRLDLVQGDRRHLVELAAPLLHHALDLADILLERAALLGEGLGVSSERCLANSLSASCSRCSSLLISLLIGLAPGARSDRGCCAPRRHRAGSADSRSPRRRSAAAAGARGVPGRREQAAERHASRWPG